jgi:hypothetical protein
MPSERFSQEFQCCLLVPPLRDEAFEHLTLAVHGPPEEVLNAVDLHENLVKVPASVTMGPHGLDAAPSDLGRENRPEPVPPEPHRLSCVMSVPRSWSRSSTFRSDSGYRMYIITARQMISGLVLK